MDGYLIRPTSDRRRRAWADLIGRDALPISSPVPRPGAAGLVYDVDVSKISPPALARLASYTARQCREPYHDVYQRILLEGLAVPAVGCALEQLDPCEV
jgi:hypothetical protein